jgi:hypothetical protein
LSHLGYGSLGQQERAKIVTELSKKMGLDGLALCSSKEDFTLIEELNIDMSEYRVPWFENIRGRELKQLFGE